MAISRELAERMGVPLETLEENQNSEGSQSGAAETTEGDNPAPGASPVVTPAPAKPVADTTAPVVVDEDAVALAAINRKRGTNFLTLDEALVGPVTAVQESPEEIKKKRDLAKITVGFKEGWLTKDDYDNYQKDSARDDRDIVFAEFSKRLAAGGKTPDQIQTAFAKLYGEDIEDDDDVSVLVKEQRAQDLKKEAARIIKRKYPSIYALDSKYDEHENTTKASKAKQAKEQAAATVYAADVNSIITSLTGKPISFGPDDDKYEGTFTYPQDLLDAIKNEFLQPESLYLFIENYDKAKVQNAIKLRLLADTDTNVIEHVAKDYHTRQMKKLKIGRNHMEPEDVRSTEDSGRAGKSILAQRMASLEE